MQHPPGRLDMTRFDTAARVVLRKAQQEAEGLGATYIISTALLLAFVDEATTVASKALKAAGIDRESVLSAHKACLGDRPVILGNKPFGVVRDSIISAIDRAERNGAPQATADDLFIGLLIKRAGLAVEVITRVGGDIDALIREAMAASGDSRQG